MDIVITSQEPSVDIVFKSQEPSVDTVVISNGTINGYRILRRNHQYISPLSRKVQ